MESHEAESGATEQTAERAPVSRPTLDRPDRPAFLTPQEACRELRICRTTLEHWIDVGVLPTVKIRGKRLVPWSEIDRLTGQAQFGR